MRVAGRQFARYVTGVVTDALIGIVEECGGDADSPKDKRLELMVSALARSAPDKSRHPSRATEGELFDGREMVMVHDVLRREFGLLPGVVSSLRADEQCGARADTIAWHIKWLVRFLHHHHSTEDHYIWPLLVQRCDHGELTARMESQHEEIAARLDTVVRAAEVWDVERTVASRDLLEHALRELIPPLSTHLSDEEKLVVPLMETYIGADEVGRAVEAGLANFPPGETALLMGMVMYEGDQEMVSRVVATMPPDLGARIRVVAPREFARHSEQVHGTRTPPRSSDLSVGRP
jgi:hemerythrin-like domain-containing protein